MDATLEAGLVMRGSLRNWLKEKAFYGEVEEWTELKGFLESSFLVRGMSEAAWREFEAIEKHQADILSKRRTTS